MHSLVVGDVKDGQQNQTCGTEKSKEDSQNSERLFAAAAVGSQSASVAQPAVCEERKVKSDCCDDTEGDEHGLKPGRGANVAHVRDMLIGVHGDVVLAVSVDGPADHHAEKHAQPYAAGEDREKLRKLAKSLEKIEKGKGLTHKVRWSVDHGGGY